VLEAGDRRHRVPGLVLHPLAPDHAHGLAQQFSFAACRQALSPGGGRGSQLALLTAGQSQLGFQLGLQRGREPEVGGVGHLFREIHGGAELLGVAEADQGQFAVDEGGSRRIAGAEVDSDMHESQLVGMGQPDSMKADSPQAYPFLAKPVPERV
jgi:hypothetical protein